VEIISKVEHTAVRQAAREWSCGDASDIDGQTGRSKERDRMSQHFRSALRRMVRPRRDVTDWLRF
jgi:hypothetical protein